MCESMVDVQSPTAKIRRGKKKRKKEEETMGQKYNVRICYAGQHTALLIKELKCDAMGNLLDDNVA